MILTSDLRARLPGWVLSNGMTGSESGSESSFCCCCWETGQAESKETGGKAGEIVRKMNRKSWTRVIVVEPEEGWMELRKYGEGN